MLGALTAITHARSAHADPQGRVAVRSALCATGDDDGLWQRTHWCNGVTGDLLFLRQRNRDFGLGPYLELSTAGFWDVRWGGGGTLLLPVSDSFPVLISLGAYGHGASSPALAATVFFGLRSYNFDGSYNAALGVYASAYRDLGSEHASLASAGVELDGVFFAAPFLLAWQALR